MTTLYQDDQEQITALLVGHRIVEARMREGGPYYGGPQAWLTLDDGTVLEVTGNDGCGGCTAGHYWVEKVATVDNIITNVEFYCEPKESQADPYYEDDQYYKIFVITENEKIAAVEIEGSDGNGWYGTGYSINVKVAK